MKVIILAGGLGTRISEETYLKPKPMIEIGGRPLLWHIMKIYSAYDINEFIICCGYKGYQIKEYFMNYFQHQSDMTIDLQNNTVKIHKKKSEPWRVTLIDTGENTLTGGRLKRVLNFVDNEKEFCFTYGDGLGDINIKRLIEFHRAHGKIATLTAVNPPGRFGALLVEGNKVTKFQEKPKGDNSLINGGFFILSPKVINYIKDDSTSWEKEPLEQLVADDNLYAYKHDGFWQPMDTLRDKNFLEELWANGNAPWKVWA